MDLEDLLGLVLVVVVILLSAGLLAIAAKIAWLMFVTAWAVS